MRMYKLAALFIIAIIVSPNLTIVRGQTLTLVPFDAEYEPGDDVSLSGTATAEANLTLIVVFNSTTIHEANFTVEEDGNYTEEYDIPGDASDGVYTVTVSDGGESVEADFTVSSDNSEIFAETLIEQAEDAKDNVEDAFDELEDVEIPPEANSSYLQGIEYLDMANEDFDEGNYTEASEMAYEAIQLFGDAFERVQDLVPVEPDDDDDEDGDDETGSPERLAVAIERAYVYWSKINETVTRLSGDGYNVTRVEEALDDAKGHLDMASMYQEEGNHTAAVREFTAARTSMGRIHGYIQSKIKERKEKQTEQFLAQFERRVDKITGVLEGLQESLEAGKTQRVRAVLRTTAQKLLRLSDSLAGGDLEGVLDDLEDAVDELEGGIDEFNGDGLSKQIKSANRFEAKIESLNKTLQRFVKAGYETPELDEYLTDAQGLLAEIEAAVQEGDEEGAEELIDEAEELIDETRDHIKEFRKESKKASISVESGRGRPDNPGRSGEDDDEEDDDENGVNVTASSGNLGSNNITEELEELATVISGIENRLGGLSTNLSTTDIELIIENATALMEEAKVLIDDNPDGAEELVEAAEELVEEALNLVEDMTDHDDEDGVEVIEPEDDDDDDELDDHGDDDVDGSDEGIDDHGDDDPDDHGDDEEPETTV